MVGQLGAQVGLLAFAAAVFAGLHAGNSAATILTRALLMLAGALILACAAAWTIKLVLRDHVQLQKRQIDEEHVRAAAADSADDATARAGGGGA